MKIVVDIAVRMISGKTGNVLPATYICSLRENKVNDSHTEGCYMNLLEGYLFLDSFFLLI